MWNGGSIVVCQWVLVCAMLMLNVTSPASLEAQGLLENPPAGLTLPQSGAGLVSGWYCNAEQIDIEIDGSAIFQAAYGTSREDTLTECGDADNGFGLLVNWNLIELANPGITHTVRALADSVEFGRAEVTIVTFGEELLTGAAGTFNLDADFLGRTVTVQWREALQNFVIIGATVEARLENPETVFRILENNRFSFSNGFFGGVSGQSFLEFGTLSGSSSLETSFSITDTNGSSVQGIVTGGSCDYSDFQDSSFPSGEGPQNGDEPVNCPVCDMRISAEAIPPGGQGPGLLFLDLDVVRNAETLANPALSSDPLPVTVGLNNEGKLTSINGIAVDVDFDTDASD